MPNYLSNIWVITKEQFEPFTYTGGKVIYIAEDVEPMFRTHPAIVTAGILLPPINAIQYELDNRLIESYTIYDDYLQMEEPDKYISILIAAAIKQIPIGVMFGKDESNMQFPNMLLDFLTKHYGLVLGLINNTQSFIIEEFLPFDLAKLYNMNIIDYPTFMEKHPQLPIHQSAYSKLIYEVRPLVKEKNLQHYIEYFESVKDLIIKNNRRFLIDPIVGA